MIAYLVNTIFITLLVGLSIAAWITNVIWTFTQVEAGMILLGILGILFPLFGMINGLIIWF